MRAAVSTEVSYLKMRLASVSVFSRLKTPGVNKAFVLGCKKTTQEVTAANSSLTKEKQGVALRLVAKEISIVWMFSVCSGFFLKEKISQAIQLGRMLLGRLGRKLHGEDWIRGHMWVPGCPQRPHG